MSHPCWFTTRMVSPTCTLATSWTRRLCSPGWSPRGTPTVSKMFLMDYSGRWLRIMSLWLFSSGEYFFGFSPIMSLLYSSMDLEFLLYLLNFTLQVTSINLIFSKFGWIFFLPISPINKALYRTYKKMTLNNTNVQW